MSGFNNPTNETRVLRMAETLGLIEKSAKSNRATPEEVAELLRPLLDELRDLGVLDTAPSREAPPEPSPRGRVGASAPTWASVIDMAREAPLKDLSNAVAVFLTRLEEELDR